MILEITRQERYSRGELLLRSLFGWLYILLPHAFLLMFMSLAGAVLTFIAFWSILFTGSYPESFFEFQVKLHNWSTRVNASLWNLVDGYPAFGLSGSHEGVRLEIPYPQQLSRGHLLAKAFFGLFYCALPHIFVLYFRILATLVAQFIAWWVVLFTAEYPAGMHRFIVGTLRWSLRLSLYLGYMTDEYPPFHGRPTENEVASAQPQA
jgi:hypothetical protein